MDKGRVKPESGLNVRNKPNGEKIGVLSHNEEVELLDEVIFYRVKTRSGQVGYVHGDYIEKRVPGKIFEPGTVKDSPWTPAYDPVDYAHERFVGEKLRVDRDFTPQLDKIAEFAARCDVKVWVTSSTRQLNNQVDGAIVKPAQNSCHHIGHAIDMNVVYRGELYNSEKLRKSNHARLPSAVVAFIDLIRRDPQLRWGGDFSVQDPVHIDDNLFNNERVLYMAKIDSRVNMLNAQTA